MQLSIITINYNNAQGLAKTLASVASQTCKEFEHIIVDGGSNDGSKEIVEEYAKDAQYSVKWVSERDKGIYNGMNKGILMATGEYIQILNSGDCLAGDDVVEKMLDVLNRLNNQLEQKYSIKNGTTILYGNMLKQYPNRKFVKDRCLGDRTKLSIYGDDVWEVEWTMNDFIKGTINHDPTYIRKDLFGKYGMYDENLKICSDWKWFFKAVVLGGEKVYYTPLNVTIFDMTGVSETNLDFREKERHSELEKLVPAAILKDYDRWHFNISQVRRLKKHHCWVFVHFAERVLFKFNKWGVLK